MGANLEGTYLIETDLTGAKKLKVEQLLQAFTLFKIRGLPSEMEKELRKKMPVLFEDP